MSANGVFVTGTGTGIGKTLASAWLVRSWGADYWKPVQSGADERDADVIRQAVPNVVIHPSAYLLKEPLSPHESARRQGVTIRLDVFRLPPSRRPVVVEGAGGVLVPLNDHDQMVDLMALLGLPVVVVASSGLGTINHTLMTLEALRQRRLPVAGVIMSGAENPSNRQAIESFGGVKVVAEMPLVNGPLAVAKLPKLRWAPESLCVD